MKYYKLLFFSTLILGTLISISSYSWLGMWMGLEINMISIMPLFSHYKNMYSSEASIKYFITQALASMMILFSIIMFSMNSCLNMNLNSSILMVLNSALLTKMGAAPFHFWFPEVMEGLSWWNNLILLTWQKIAPMILIMYNSNFSMFFFMIIVFCMLISSIIGFNQISLRKILTFSSINHIGWMLSALLLSKMIWMFYFIVYTIISINIVFIFNKFKMYFINQLIMIFNYNSILKMFFMMNFFSLGGIPPFIGFLPKWFVINQMTMNNQMMLTFIMIVFTLMTFYFYMRTMFSSLIINFDSPIIVKQIKIKNFYMVVFNFLALFSLILFPVFFSLY